MKCVLYGTFENANSTHTVDLTSLGFTDPEDYVVIVNGTWLSNSNTTYNSMVITKTATSVTFGVAGATSTPVQVHRGSYQILANKTSN